MKFYCNSHERRQVQAEYYRVNYVISFFKKYKRGYCNKMSNGIGTILYGRDFKFHTEEDRNFYTAIFLDHILISKDLV